MGLIQKMTDRIRQGLRNFILTPAPATRIIINEDMDRLTSCVKNRIWYNGKSKQLSELYTQITAPATMFWKARSTKGQEIRKIHTGLPARIVDIISDIVMNDYNGIEVNDKNSNSTSERWEQIEKENKFTDILKEALKDIGVVGDGAFKISYDKSISDTPIIEWYPAENVEFTYVRGRIREVKFYADYTENNKAYQFCEIYGYGYIRYELYNDLGNQIKLNSISATSWIDSEGVKFDDSVMWAVPVIYGKSQQYKGRGKSIIEGKEDAFDSLDEAWSQWMDALRSARVKTYIPQTFLPYNEENGKVISPNPFDNRFIELMSAVDESGKSNTIRTEAPVIQSDAYLSAYVTALDLCLQGIISPSTLGIDVKKLDNAEAQREKEKTTLYTRQNYVELLESVLPQLVKAVLNADSLMKSGKLISDIDVSVKFGEYANPSFESQVETVGKAKQSGIMSIERCVEELYGDSMKDDEKAEEVQLIKEQLGIAIEPETSEFDDIDNNPIGF